MMQMLHRVALVVVDDTVSKVVAVEEAAGMLWWHPEVSCCALRSCLIWLRLPSTTLFFRRPSALGGRARSSLKP